MLTIKQPRISDNKLECEIIENDTSKVVWFSVEDEYVKYLCHENCDAFLIAILNYAMRNKHDIKLDAPVTDTLLYNINHFLIPSLTKYDSALYETKIFETSVMPAVENAGAVGTGLSCGVDSFHSVLTNLNSKYPSLKLTHVCINNVGSFNECYGEGNALVA